MEFVFVGNPNDPRDNTGEVTFFGIRFPLNVPVRVTDERAAKKLMSNNHFILAEGSKRFHASPKLIIPDDAVIPSVDAPAKPRRKKTAEAVA